MPELPEVESIRRGLERTLVGRRVERVIVRERALRRPVDPGALARAARGRVVEGVGRRAKYLLITFRGGRALVLHLGMSGQLVLAPRGESFAPHTHVVLVLEGDVELRFRDHRRFGLVETVDAALLPSHPALARLGVEPLSEACTGEYLWERARGLRRSVKSFLMDGRFVVGLGNIYATEALYASGILPQRAAGRLRLARWRRLVHAIRDVLERAIEAGGTTLRDFRAADGQAGGFGAELEAYGREGEPCRRCGGRIRRVVLGGRSSYYCGRCQR